MFSRLSVSRMSQYDADLYEKFAAQVRKQVQALKLVISGLQAKAKDRQWLKNQTMGKVFGPPNTCFQVTQLACFSNYVHTMTTY